MTQKEKGRLSGLLLAVMLLLLMPALVFAQHQSVEQNLGAALLRTVAALLFILGLFFIFVYLMKRFFPGVFVSTAADRSLTKKSPIELLATRQLGPKRYLHHIRVGEREFLIGAGDQGISKLGEWRAEAMGELADKSDGEPEKSP
jgi:flagellar biogenesis protein FliO